MRIYILKLLFIIIIFKPNNGYTQELINNKNIIKKNYKKSELIYCNREMREKETNIIKAKFNENYSDNKYKSPDSISFSYLKEKHKEFGLSKDLEDIRIKNITTTSAGNYVHLEQHINNIPVYAATATVTINNKGNVTFFVNNFKDLNKYNNIYIKPKITSAAAINLARKYFNTQEEELINPTSELIYFESGDKGLELAWKIYTLIKNRPGAWLIIINAVNERIIHVDDISQKWDFPAKVYKTNPLQKANKNYGDHVWINGFEYIYEDNNDANSIALENELETVTLRDLTIENGILKLKGPYCKVVDIVYPNNHTIPEFIPANADFDFTRDQEEFEAVMVYYHVDLAGRWVHSLLGYIPYGLQEFKADPHGVEGFDNNEYVPGSNLGNLNYIHFGDGGVDGAEDAEIIWHEYGHAVQYNLGEHFTSEDTEALSINEGTSDYWACSYSRSLSSNNWEKFADWDMHNEFFPEWKKRRVDRPWGYNFYKPDSTSGHYNGQIWSSALMLVWNDLGREITDRLLLDAIISWGNGPGFQVAAEAFINADFNLYNAEHVCTIIEHFNERGLTDLEPGTETFTGPTIVNRGISGCDVILDDVNVTYNTILHVTAARNVTFQGTFETGTNARLIIE